MKIFCDFDGTAAANDVGQLLFRNFADHEKCLEIVQEWKDGEISSKECLVRECLLARVTKPELQRFVDKQRLDPFFKDFAAFCDRRDLDIEIVSDGFDFYIERILHNHGLDSRIEFHSNRLCFLDGNQIRPEFPYYEDGCGVCANCKGLHVRRARQHHRTIVYVGDGLSDRCGAREADIVFAKRGRDLLKYCRTNGVKHFEFSTFQDVLNTMKSLVT